MKGFSLSTIVITTLLATASQAGLFPYTVLRHTLDNQFKIIMIPMESPGLASYFSIVRTGSRDEFEPGHSGFAHFFEHMMFRGTKNYPGDVYDKIMTGIGAHANAYTSDDLTCFHLTFAQEDMETVMKLESDRFINLSYSEEAFKTEASTIYGEFLKGLASPWQQLGENLLFTAFTKHTYRHEVIGFRADIEAMPTMYEFSQSFYSRYYRPENVVLLIVGDIDPETIKSLAVKYYGDWKPGYVAPIIPAEPAQPQKRQVNIQFPGRSLPIIAMAFKGTAFQPESMEMAANTLFADAAFGTTSDLYKKLVIDEQRVQFIDSDMGMNRDPGLMTLYAMVNDPQDIAPVIAEMNSTIQHFQQQQITEQKLTDLKDHASYSFLMNLDTPEKVAGRLTRFVAMTGDVEAVDQYYATLQKVAATDIQKTAQSNFGPEKCTVAVLKGEE